MTPLGKPLVFYLKYSTEMDLLYSDGESEDDEADLKALQDAEQVRKMARSVGAAANEHVADFLELCAIRIESYFKGLGIATRVKKRTRPYLIRNWEGDAKVYVDSVPGGRFYCGVSIGGKSEVRNPQANLVCGLVWVWLWCKGGNMVADEVWKIVRGFADARAVEGFERGTIVLGRIPITAQTQESFEVDSEPLVSEAMKVISLISVEEAKAIAQCVAKLKLPDQN